jgi:SET domain-containing protein
MTPKKKNTIDRLTELVLRRLLKEELQIKARVAPSSISGLGLFAAEDIPKGAVVFRWNDQIDQEYSKNYPDQLPPDIKKDFMSLASVDDEGWFLAGDGGAYFNHSEEPNIGVDGGEMSPAKRDRFASQDIEAGEELTMDYSAVGNDVPQRNRRFVT